MTEEEMQAKVDSLFAAISASERLRLLIFFKSRHAPVVLEKLEMKLKNLSGGGPSEPPDQRLDLARAVGKGI